MKISGFTYVRNGFMLGYPFIASIKSILPIVDELIVVVGDSTDDTRKAIENLGSSKIRIIDSEWNDALRLNGRIFAQQTNIGINNITGDWGIHLQVDEVLHETALQKIPEYIRLADKNENADGLLFPFYHFWGDYSHIRNTRKTHAFEIRAFKNNGRIFSYKDSQGFRKYSSLEGYDSGEKGLKLNVLLTDVPVFHYSYTRNPGLMKKKSNYFHRFWHDDTWLQQNTSDQEFDFNDVDRLEVFCGEHPGYMKEIIEHQDWQFVYDPSKSNMNLKERMLNMIERTTGKRLFMYRNFKIVRPEHS